MVLRGKPFPLSSAQTGRPAAECLDVYNCASHFLPSLAAANGANPNFSRGRMHHNDTIMSGHESYDALQNPDDSVSPRACSDATALTNEVRQSIREPGTTIQKAAERCSTEQQEDEQQLPGAFTSALQALEIISAILLLPHFLRIYLLF